jgi:hypothetical protein
MTAVGVVAMRIMMIHINFSVLLKLLAFNMMDFVLNVEVKRFG